MEHLVIVHSRHLRHILSGEKRMEARLSRRRIAPIGAVKRGDLLWFKEVSGPVVARGHVQRVWNFECIGRDDRREILERFGARLAAPGWLAKSIRRATYATFIKFGRVELVEPFRINKQDRRAWVCLRSSIGRTFRRRSI